MEYIIDTLKLSEKVSAHKYLKELFAFPEYYGNNLDSLYDCLTERTNITVIFENRPADTYAEKILKVFELCEKEGYLTLIKRWENT